MARNSDKKLAAALREAKLPALAVRAEAGEFNDYFGDHMTPKMTLVDELRAAEAPDSLIKDVIEGEFDSGKAEREEWLGTDEAKHVRALMSE